MADIFDTITDEPEGDIFDQIASMPNPHLSDVRSRYVDELSNPEIVSRLYSLTHREVGGQGPEAQQAFIETVLNRAAARNKSLAETVSDPNYYPRQSLRAAGLGPEDVGRYGQLAVDALKGSNVSNYATGNASGNVGFAGGPQTFKAGGERFGIEGPDRNWAEEVQRFTSNAPLIAGTPTAASVQAAQGDIFDQVAAEPAAEPKGDVFDQAEEPPKPQGPTAEEAGGITVAGQYVPEEQVPAAKAVLGGLENLQFVQRNLLDPIKQVAELKRAAAEAPPQPAEEYDLLYYKTGKTKSERAELNRPLHEAMQVPLVSPETVAAGLRGISSIGAMGPEDLEQGPIEKGVTGEVAQAISGLTTGEGAAALPAYMFPPTAVGLTAGDVQDLPADVTETIQKLQQGDKESAAAAATRALMKIAMSGAVIKGAGAVSGPKSLPEAMTRLEAEKLRTAVTGDVAARARTRGINAEEARLAAERAAVKGPEVEPATPGARRPSAPYQTYQPEWFEAAAPAELQKATATGEPIYAQQEPSPARVPSAQVRPGVVEEAPLRQPGKTPAIHGEEEVPGGGPAPEAQAAVAPEPYTREAAEARAAAGEPERVFGTKNAITDAARQDYGIPPAEPRAARSGKTIWEASEAIEAGDPYIGERLIKELKENTRPIKDVEEAQLLREEIKAATERDAALEQANSSPGDPLAEARLSAARDKLQDIFDITKKVGTEWSASGRARQLLAKQDFSLTKMEAEYRAIVNKGAALEEPQLAEVKALWERIANAEAKVSAFEAKEAFEAALKDAKAAGKTKGFKVQDFLDQQAQRARERIVARRGKLYADPIGVTQVAHLADEAIIGASHIARGVTKFADWSAAMIRELGENIKPFLKDLYKRAQAIASEGTKTSKLTPEERMKRALAGDVKRILTRTEQVKEKLRKGDFEKPVKKPPRMSPEKSTAMYQYAKAKEAYHHALIKAQRAARPMWRKAAGGVEEAVATARAVKTAYDLSAVLRQGGAQVMAHPIRARNAFARMIESLKSDEGMFRINEEIKSRPNAQNGKYAQYKLFLSDPEVGASLGKMEEVYASRLAQHIPGVRMSERGYVTFLNVMRADSMDALINAFETPNRKLTLNEGRALANYVNIATGRGNLGKLAAAARPLSLGLFAPRYMLSRFQYLIGQPLWGGSMRTRMLIAREYGQTAMGVGLIVALGLAAGATMETDFNSTDAGKLKFGNTRIDPWFGLQQHMVYLNRLWTGKRKTAEGKTVYVRGPKAKYGEADITARFLRSKAAPLPGAVMDLYYGEDYVGNEVSLLSAAKNLVSPLSIEDIAKVMIEQGVPVGTAMGLLSFFGMGVSTYGPHKKKFKAGPVKNPYPEGTGRVNP